MVATAATTGMKIGLPDDPGMAISSVGLYDEPRQVCA
jgi:hypothetical protein